MFKKFSFYTVLIIIIFSLCYSFINYFFDRKSFDFFGIKGLFSDEQKEIVRRYLFPQRLIKLQEKQLLVLNRIIPKMTEFELLFKNSLQDIKIKKLENVKLSNGMTMEKYNLVNGFYSGIKNEFPGSGYLDFHKDNLFVLSSRGIISYINLENLNDENYLKQIENNIDDFLGLSQYQKTHTLSLKDLFVHNNKIYISYTEEIKKDCWNTSVIHGNINYKSIQFEKIFASDECINRSSVPEFEFHQSGGRIVQFDNSNILLTVGEYRDRALAQNENNINGKTLKIDADSGDYEIISMGHRNPQGMYFDKKNDFIIQTEHGPKGGDEVNIIEVKNINNKKILNYGWPVSSYGEHYRGEKGGEKYKKFPLHKSHSEYGFIEPIKYFVPSIGISEVTKIDNDQYVLSSLRDKSLYFFKLDNKKLSNLKRVTVNERIRDITFKDNKLYLFLEDTASLGIVALN
tara:strand:+ start:5168 stop:6541 length:1374 start_codon:yes stop_codon:yes gene_type:complete